MSAHAVESPQSIASPDHHSRAATSCTNCGAPGALVYCANCGEKQPDHHDYSVAHFVGHVFHELLHVDSKLLGTLRLLITQPGALTVEYFAGRKSRYIAPLRLFLVLFALFFLAYTAYKPMSMYSLSTILKHDDKGAVKVLVDKVAKKKQLTREEVAERIDHQWQHTISLVQLLNIVLVGFVLAAVTAGRGRYLAEHFTFAAHYLSFTYVFALVTWPVRYAIGFGPGLANRITITCSLLLMFTYLHLAMRRFYKTGVVRSVLAYAGIYVFGVLMVIVPFIIAILLTLR